MTRTLFLAAAALLSSPVLAQAPEPPSPERLRATVERLVSFGTRHTLSSATDPARGIGAARRWGAGELEGFSEACGGCLEVTTISDRFSGERAPNGVVVENVLAIQRGANPGRVVIIQGHIDSRVTDPLDFTSDSPGANDDGSGTALVIEAARILSNQQHDATIVYALLSGEEQGLWGGELLARHATAQGWQVLAVLNNDIVGNTVGTSGAVVDDRVRVFSEGIRAVELADAEAGRIRRGIGGEDDGPSRALARAVDRIGREDGVELEVFRVERPDRFSRGGDHIPFLAAGFPAVRFTVGIEHYDHQHQDLRTENSRVYGDTIDYMDFAYLARVTALNVAVARELANAPPPPASATIEGAVSANTTVSWDPVAGAAGYRVHWRRTDERDWREHRDVTGTDLVLENVIIDDNFFGVASLAESGEESIVTFAGGAVRR